jgi:hypothetical protein
MSLRKPIIPVEGTGGVLERFLLPSFGCGVAALCLCVFVFSDNVVISHSFAIQVRSGGLQSYAASSLNWNKEAEL